ncbi:MAG: hypothetical protein JNJ98_14655 [Gemmatimonadetes bacterium]|nr:hypothetical protein [Gemmatimonadota bacterium]
MAAGEYPSRRRSSPHHERSLSVLGTAGRYLLSVVLVVLSSDALRQAMNELGDTEPGSRLFAVLQLVMGVTAAMGAVGVFRRSRWATMAIATWGIATASLLASQPVFEPMDADAEQGIWIGAAAMLVAAAVAAWFARRLAAPRPLADPSNQRQGSPDPVQEPLGQSEPILPRPPFAVSPVPAEQSRDKSPARPGDVIRG